MSFPYKVVRHEKSHESAEDYLENILILRERNGNVRSIDIVNEMNYSKPSISIAMKKLRTEGYGEMDLKGTRTRYYNHRLYQTSPWVKKCITPQGDENLPGSTNCPA